MTDAPDRASCLGRQITKPPDGPDMGPRGKSGVLLRPTTECVINQRPYLSALVTRLTIPAPPAFRV